MNKRAVSIGLSISFLFVLLLAVFQPVAAAPTVKWVDAVGGNDANDGDTQATAYATLQTALANSMPGTDNANRSIINVMDGTYTGAGIAEPCDGFPAAVVVKDLDWLTIQAAPGEEPVIKPPAGVVSLIVKNSDHLIVDNIDSDQTVGLADNWHVCDSDDITVRNLHFEGGKDGIDFTTVLTAALIENNTFSNIISGSGDEVLDFTDFTASNVTIQDNTFTNVYRSITIFPPTGTSSNFLIQRNMMNGTTSEEHIRLINTTDSTLVNNVIMNSLQQGLYIDDGCSNIKLWQNTFFNNALGGRGDGELRTKISTADIDIRNNIFYGALDHPIFETETGVTSLPGEDYNLVYNYTLSGPFTTFGTNTLIGLDPLFVSTTSGSEDLHLTSGSPAIEAAPTLGVTDDKDKNARPDPSGSDPDMGAYEFPALITSYCPAENDYVVTARTEMLGVGQGSRTKGYRTRKLVIPYYDQVEALYGQLAAVDVGVMKYVRFRYPDQTYEQIYAPTSLAYRWHAVSWWGSELDAGVRYVKGQFFWGAKGNKSPRAFVLWPTYDTDPQLNANVFVTFDESSENHAAWALGWYDEQTQVVEIPETQAAGATVVVRLAIVDNDDDERPVNLDVTVGPDTQSLVTMSPNSHNTLNLHELTFYDVPAGVDQVTIHLQAPAPSVDYPEGGDSAAIIGAAVSYSCAMLAR